MSEKPETLTAAVRRLAAAERAAQTSDLPAPEDLVAYRDGKLEPEARAALERALSLNSEAAQEYLDLVDPSRLKPPEDHPPQSDPGIQVAFEALRHRLRQEGLEVPEEEVPEASVLPFVAQRIRRLQVGLKASALAAILILSVAGVLIARLYQQLESSSAPRFAAVIDVHPTRGERPATVSNRAGQLLLVFHDAQLEPYPEGQLEIIDRDGRLLLSHRFEAEPGQDSLLYLPVPQALLPVGSYRLRIFGLRDGERQLVQDYSLRLVPPESGSQPSQPEP